MYYIMLQIQGKFINDKNWKILGYHKSSIQDLTSGSRQYLGLTCAKTSSPMPIGNFIIKGKLPNKKNTQILYWASRPCEYGNKAHQSPYYGYHETPNKGGVVSQNGDFQFYLEFPSGYKLEENTLDPHIHIMVCDGNKDGTVYTIKLNYLLTEPKMFHYCMPCPSRFTFGFSLICFLLSIIVIGIYK